MQNKKNCRVKVDVRIVAQEGSLDFTLEWYLATFFTISKLVDGGHHWVFPFLKSSVQ